MDRRNQVFLKLTGKEYIRLYRIDDEAADIGDFVIVLGNYSRFADCIFLSVSGEGGEAICISLYCIVFEFERKLCSLGA